MASILKDDPAPPEAPPYLHAAGSEPIPGYRLLAPLGRGGYGEVWKCEAPGGLLKAIKFVPNDARGLDEAAPAAEELAAIERIKGIRHPFILSMERVEVVGDELVIVMELADQSLGDLLAEARAAGQPGLPRAALLGYLREAAEALDLMHSRHGLQHLDIKPHNLFLVSSHVKVGDFGLVSHCSAGGPSAVSLGAITPLYASPEVFQGRVSAHSDQYSLAVVYQELLTGTLPFTGKSARALLMQHLTAPPDLAALPEADRAAVARALAKSPAERFASCSDLVQALATGHADVVTATVVRGPASPQAETRTNPQTLTRRATAVRPPAQSRVCKLTIVRRTPLAEIWAGTGADGQPRQVQVLFGGPANCEEAVAQLASLHHPVLIPATVLRHSPGRLVLSVPAPAATARDGLAQWQAQGEPGVPRARALAYLRPIAEALDDLARRTGVAHLALSPRCLVLEDERLALADFGLAQLFWLPGGQPVAQVNARYAAPELARGEHGPACDQYSLALIYHELVTGALPPTRSGQGLALDLLPEGDRAVIARALSADPRRRWGSLAELFDALEALGPAERLAQPAPSALASADPEPVLQMRFGTSLAVEQIHDRLTAFGQRWQAERVGGEGAELLVRLKAPRNHWQQAEGDRQPELLLHLVVGEPEEQVLAGIQSTTEVFLTLRAADVQGDQAHRLLDLFGPLLAESLRNHLRASGRARAQERLVWHHPLQVCALLPDGGQGPPIECQGKDISLNGIGFYLPGEVPAAQVLLLLPPTPQTPTRRVPARVVRAQKCGEGWTEIGAVLLPPDELPEE